MEHSLYPDLISSVVMNILMSDPTISHKQEMIVIRFQKLTNSIWSLNSSFLRLYSSQNFFITYLREHLTGTSIVAVLCLSWQGFLNLHGLYILCIVIKDILKKYRSLYGKWWSINCSIEFSQLQNLSSDISLFFILTILRTII